MNIRIHILSLSASQRSVSRSCLPLLKNRFENLGAQVGVTDIRKIPPVWVDDRDLDAYPQEYQALFQDIQTSHGVVLMLPIYCYSISSPAKAITEIIGDAFEYKPTGFVVAAGSPRSHLAIGDLMCSMMFEQETICFPKHVVSHRSDLNEEYEPMEELQQRLIEFSEEFINFVKSNSTK